MEETRDGLEAHTPQTTAAVVTKSLKLPSKKGREWPIKRTFFSSLRINKWCTSHAQIATKYVAFLGPDICNLQQAVKLILNSIPKFSKWDLKVGHTLTSLVINYKDNWVGLFFTTKIDRPIWGFFQTRNLLQDFRLLISYLQRYSIDSIVLFHFSLMIAINSEVLSINLESLEYI